jgi:phenylacetate-CoA ligase
MVCDAMSGNESPSLHRILEFAARSVPRYRGLPSAAEEFPVTRKRDILRHLSDYLAEDQRVDKVRLVDFLQNPSRKKQGATESIFEGRVIVEETSGTSGIPFGIPKTVEERTRCSIGIWNYRRSYDAQASPRQFYPFIHEPDGFFHSVSPRLFSQNNIDQLYQNLSAKGIRWVHGNPGLLQRHATAMSEPRRATHTVRFAESSGWSLAAEVRRNIEAKMNLTVVDQYGCREVWAIGTRIGDAPFQTVNDNVYVEILDDTDQPVREPGREGRIVVTSLVQRLMPFIRYDTGDIGAWASPDPSLGFRLSDARQQNLLSVPGKRISGNSLFRSILIVAYRNLGTLPVSYIQIQQVNPRQFVVITNRFPEAAALTRTVETLFNQRKFWPDPAVFMSVQLEEQEIQLALERKPMLFCARQVEDVRER